MAKHDPTRPKFEVPEAGNGRALKHNPFGALMVCPDARWLALLREEPKGQLTSLTVVGSTTFRRADGRVVKYADWKRVTDFVASLRVGAETSRHELVQLFACRISRTIASATRLGGSPCFTERSQISRIVS
jgi:hypothetical protein